MPPRTLRATPAPLGIATSTPTTRDLGMETHYDGVSDDGVSDDDDSDAVHLSSPLLTISWVGHLSTPPHSIQGHTTSPITKPHTRQITSESSSLTTPRLRSLESPTTAPNTPARMGPMMGEISMLATRVTLLDSTDMDKNVIRRLLFTRSFKHQHYCG